MRKVLVCFILLLFLLPMEVAAEEVPQEEIQAELFKQFEFSEIDKTLSDIFPNEKMGFLDTVMGLISGDLEFSFTLVKNFIRQQFIYELEYSKAGLIHILILVIVAAVFSNFSSVFKSTQVSEISFFMLYMLLITICLDNFRVLTDSVLVNLEKLVEFMKLLGPIYFLAVGMATGSSTSLVFYQLVLLIILLVEILIMSFLVPITQIYLMMRILGNFSTDIPLSKFAEFLETIVKWSLKTLTAGVIGFNVIQGLIHPAIDTVKRSLMLKGGEALPIIGNIVGGATEIVLGTAVLIKNGIGVAGMLICLMICLVPTIQMAVTVLLYKFLAALIQPISDKRMVNCVNSIADGTGLLLKIVITTGILFLLTIAIVATTTGG